MLHPSTFVRRNACLLLLSLASSATAQVPPAPKPVADDWVTLTLVTDDPHVSLYAKDPRLIAVGDQVSESWSFVCKEPCGLRVDPRRTYRVMGESLVPSVEFNVAPGSGRVTLRVNAKRPPNAAVTAGLATTGAIVALGGVLFLLLDLAEHGAGNALSGSSSTAQANVDGQADTYGEVGAGMLAGGVVLGGAALIYLLTGGKTELAPADSAPPRKQADLGNGVRAIPFGFAF